MKNLIIPDTLTKIAPILTQYLEPLKLWFSQYIYDRFLERHQNHPLVILNQIVDFSAMEEACADYHHQKGPGRCPTHTVPKLVRAIFIQYYSNYSLRGSEFHIRCNLLIKWFVGYDIFDEGPDHSTLNRFETYLALNYPRLLFDVILKQIDNAFPDDHKRPQIGDTFAILANAAMESLIKRLRHSCQQLLLAYKIANPSAYDKLWVQLDRKAIFGFEKEKIEYHLSTGQRKERLLNCINGIRDCLAVIEKETLAKPVQKWVVKLEKILADELCLNTNKEGRVIEARLLPKEERGTYRICSGTDPDATIRNHGPDKQDFGYNGSVAATVNFVREIRADTGSQPDAAAIPALLEEQIEQHDICPHKFLYDQAAGLGKYAAEVDEVTNGKTQLVVDPKPTKKKSDEQFSPQDFILSEDEKRLTCPNDVETQRKYRSGSGDGYNFRFMAPDCAGCPFVQKCRGKKNKPPVADPPITPRNVFISDYYLFYKRLVDYSGTDEFKSDMKLRPQIERVIAGLVLFCGARRARFRGVEKVDYQMKMCGTVYNVKRWLVLLSGKRHKKRRRFGAPLPSQRLFVGEVGLMAA